MVYELTIAASAVLAFILGWIHQIIYKNIKKDEDQLLEKITNKMNLLLKDSENLIKINKSNFIRDLAGLYRFEKFINSTDSDIRDAFFGFVLILVGTFIFELLGANILVFIILIMVWIIGIEISVISILYLNQTTKFIKNFNNGIAPREFSAIR